MTDELVQARLPPELAKLARKQARARGQSMAEWLRQVLREHFDQGEQTAQALEDLDRRVTALERHVVNGGS